MLIRDESRVGVNGFGLQPFELQVLQMGLIISTWIAPLNDGGMVW